MYPHMAFSDTCTYMIHKFLTDSSRSGSLVTRTYSVHCLNTYMYIYMCMYVCMSSTFRIIMPVRSTYWQFAV